MEHIEQTRRGFLKAAGLGAAALMAPRAISAETAMGKPNILYIMSDDHAAPAISCYGSWLARAARTPNIDRIAAGGMRMAHCFVTNSICTPSRAAIWTGKYSHANGVYKFTALDQSQPTLPKLMQKAGYLKSYLRCVAGIDHNVGRVLDYLDQSGLAANTLVIYTADQGFFLGEHGLYDKRFMYEEALRMPFLVRWPGKVKPGTVNDDILLNVDFAPTLLRAAGAEADPGMQGRSFLSILSGKTPGDWRKSMYYRYYYSHFKTEPHYGVRTKTHKLIYFDRIKQWELFDLTKDPTEIRNVHDNPEYAGVVKELTAELKRLQAELKDNPDDVGSKPRTGFEKK